MSFAQTSDERFVTEKIFVADPEKPIQASLAKHQIHRYRVQLEANYYIQFRVNFLGFDGSITLYSPDNKKQEEVVLPKSDEAMKELCSITKMQGYYRLEIRSVDPEGHGQYNLGVARLIENTDGNKRVIAAEQNEAEGYRLHEIGTEEALKTAIPKLQLAAQMFQEIHETWKYLESSMYLGEVYHNLSEYRKAIDLYNTLLPALDDSVYTDPTWTYNNLASGYSAIGEKEKARDFYERALKTAHEKDILLKQTRGHPLDPRSFAIALNSLGTINFQLGEKQKALDFFYQAIPYWNTARQGKPEIFGLARVYRGLSQIYAAVGDRQQALTFARQALDFSRATGDLIGQTDALNIIGVTEAADGNLGGAAESFKEALNIARLSGDRNGQAKTLLNLGTAYLNNSKLDDALHSLNDALQTLREVGNRAGEARALSGLGMLAKAQGDNKGALEFFDSALRLQSATKDREGEAETLYGMTRVHMDLGNLPVARSEIEDALRQIEFVRRSFSGAEMRASYRATVQRYYEIYIELLMLLHDRNPESRYNVRAFEQCELARARSMLESLREANADIREGVDAKFLVRERELQRLLQDKGEFQTRLLSGRYTREQAAEAEREVISLLNDYRELQTLIRRSSPRLAALTQPEPVTLGEIQKSILDPQTVLLEYSLGEKQSFLWAITDNSVTSYKLPKRSQIETLARQVYAAWSTSPEDTKQMTLASLRAVSDADRQTIANLSRMLLSPVAKRIAGKRLLVVSDGALQYIPFSALHDDRNHLLVQDHEVINLPSAATLTALRKELVSRVSPQKELIVLADPVFEIGDPRVQRISRPNIVDDEKSRSLIAIGLDASLKDLGVSKKGIPRLPSTRREAMEIGKLVPEQQRKVALDFEASRSTALGGQLSQYKIVHLATHGLINSQRPELSGIVLSLVDKEGKSQHGFLQVHEIYNLRIPADLVVLSACRTALGKDVRGEGLEGLTRGFMYAGAARVVSSLWEVDSKATAELMTYFYREMLIHKLEPAAALRAAQVSMSEDRRWQSPFYWAGFVIQGEFR